MTDNQNNMMQEQEKDQNVMAFMMQLVQEKFGDDVEVGVLNTESERLYNEFGNNLVSNFEPMLTEDQKMQFDQLVGQNSDQNVLLNFLVEAIPDLEQQILRILVSFRTDYLNRSTK